MPRPRKRRRVCVLPDVNTFGPVKGSSDADDYVYMTVEEYETIRLMDFEGLNQEESAKLMGVARSTIQRIYDEARRKLANSLVNGKVLKIEGGDYKLCSEDKDIKQCDHNTCHRHQHGNKMKTGGRHGY